MHTKTIGGQAVIEGVMMKSPEGWSVAVRDPKGTIALKTVRIQKPNWFVKLPLIRGSIALLQALIIGIKAIEFSGSVAFQEKDDEKPLSPWSIALSIGLALVLAITLFKFLPLLIATAAGNVYPEIAKSSLLFNLIDGVTRVFIFFLYIVGIGLWSEMKRIYAYHGAEHKVIYAFEAKEPLTVESARKYKPFHPRCGTSFLLIVMMISIVTFMFIPQDWPFIEKLLARIVLIPLIAGVSYETLRLSARFSEHPVMGFLVWPGLLLQRLTVREPDDSQIETAIAALNAVLKLEEPSEEGAVNA
ncbi:MAG TPA: DUF1385 domain-containing protein [Dissulfurispiraceae bacterium]|nr:DUF1385 domain-containing protein [Dissulfurispiraceae bacterium]